MQAAPASGIVTPTATGIIHFLGGGEGPCEAVLSGPVPVLRVVYGYQVDIGFVYGAPKSAWSRGSPHLSGAVRVAFPSALFPVSDATLGHVFNRAQ